MQSKASKKGTVLRLRGNRTRARRVFILGLAIAVWLTALPVLTAMWGSPDNGKFFYGLDGVGATGGSNKDIVARDLARQDQVTETKSSHSGEISTSGGVTMSQDHIYTNGESTEMLLPLIMKNWTKGGDWPMLQHDPQRSGYTDLEVRPPYEFLWRWHAPPLASRTQPVVADGILYIGSLNGKLYALDAWTGDEIWTYQTGGPIRHSAGVDDGKVFFASHDSYVYALDASTGTFEWKYKTEAGLSTAPLLANGVVYIGSRDKTFYALNQTDGTLEWSYETDGPIETSAALSEDGTIVFFGSEDMHAYALDGASGQLKWSKRLPGGQSLRDRWPVVVDDTVIFRTQPLVNFLTLMQAEDSLFDSLGGDPDWSTVEKPAIIDFLTNHPHYRDFFVLDTDSGNERFIAPVLYTFGGGDTAAMPVVNRDTGEVFVRYRFTGGFLNEVGGSAGAGLWYAPAIGKMDLKNNDITSVDAANPSDFNWQFRMISDEPSHFSLGGSMLFVSGWTRIGGIDVQSRELFEVANVMDDWFGCGNVCGAKNGPMPVYDDTFPYDPTKAVQSEGQCWQPAIIANDVIYWAIPTIGGEGYQGSALVAIRTQQ